MSFPIKSDAVVIDQGRAPKTDRWTALHPVAQRVEAGIKTINDRVNGRQEAFKATFDGEALEKLEQDAEDLVHRMRRLSQRDKPGLSRFLSRYPSLSTALEGGQRLKKTEDRGLIVSHQLGIPNAKGWA
ncbi:MAG: hypothetical protein AAFN74_21010 [Myxococcota bacterium]